MELQLKNIGMIKEANVKIDGLTVVAGESTVFLVTKLNFVT